jgi:diaminopimelate decarboxylase
VTASARAEAQELVRRFGSPLYVYDLDRVRARCAELMELAEPLGMRVLYAAKANANRDVLVAVRGAGCGLDAVSLGEAHAARRAGFAAGEISYTASNVDERELREILDMGVHATVDSLAQLDLLGRIAQGGRAGLRVNPDLGAGHHEKVSTGGPDSKFGVDPGEIGEALVIAARHRLTIDGYHQHIGSGILDAGVMLDAMSAALRWALKLPDVAWIDFGGGFGVPYQSGERAFDWRRFAEGARKRLGDFRELLRRPIEMRLSPGRYLVAESGTLLCTVTAVKRSRKHTFAGTDTGMNHLLRPALYGAYHEIENVSGDPARKERYTVVGQVCESGDVLGADRLLARVEEGHVLAVRTAGAYGFTMASVYNQRPRPAEVVIEAGSARLSRPRASPDEML